MEAIVCTKEITKIKIIEEKKEKVYKFKYKDELESFANNGDLTNDSVVLDIYIQRKIHTKPKVKKQSKVTTMKLSKEEMEEYIKNIKG